MNRQNLLLIIICGLSLAACGNATRVTPSPIAPPPLAVEEPRMCTQEAKLCPDGKSYVSRDSTRGCAFAACPTP